MLKDDESYSKSLEYIHNNPVNAGLVDDTLAYPWSSARSYAGKSGIVKVSLLYLFASRKNLLCIRHKSKRLAPIRGYYTKTGEKGGKILDHVRALQTPLPGILVCNYCVNQGDEKEA